MSPESRLANGIEFNEFATKMALAGRRAKDRGVRS
jgi:hypothetical protein